MSALSRREQGTGNREQGTGNSTLVGSRVFMFIHRLIFLNINILTKLTSSEI
ncbi:MAG: hypothetical protein ACK6A9_19265 [Dolichospermum sp.]|nr:hypothetical protein [Anabaena sp. 49628_E55]